MGLCRCPRRRVTNLFCFEHRVNVCESCLVSAHPTCIVQSYLRWLQDSDYSPDCPLCAAPLAARETVRLVCYDVFHWGCLAGRARALPPRTAPAGHRCPTCGGPLFPPPNLEGPVATALRSRLATAPWARPGLGLPLLDDAEEPPEPDPELEATTWDAPGTPPEPPPSPPPPHAVVHVGAETLTLLSGSGPRKPVGGRESRDPPDRDEDKYRRRPPLAWLPPSLRCRARGPPRPPRLLLALGGVAAFALLLLLLGGAGGGGGGATPPSSPSPTPTCAWGPDPSPLPPLPLPPPPRWNKSPSPTPVGGGGNAGRWGGAVPLFGGGSQCPPPLPSPPPPPPPSPHHSGRSRAPTNSLFCRGGGGGGQNGGGGNDGGGSLEGGDGGGG